MASWGERVRELVGKWRSDTEMRTYNGDQSVGERCRLADELEAALAAEESPTYHTIGGQAPSPIITRQPQTVANVQLSTTERGSFDSVNMSHPPVESRETEKLAHEI